MPQTTTHTPQHLADLDLLEERQLKRIQRWRYTTVYLLGMLLGWTCGFIAWGL